jgi:hypothetical protein
VKQNRQVRQIGKPEFGAYVNCAKGQHAQSQCCNAEPGHDGRSDRRNAAADENFCPGHACRIEKLPCYRAHAAGRVKRGTRWVALVAPKPTLDKTSVLAERTIAAIR